MFDSDLARAEAIVNAFLRGVSAETVLPLLWDLLVLGRGPEAAQCDILVAYSFVVCTGRYRRQEYLLAMVSLGGPECLAAVERVLRHDPDPHVRLAAVLAIQSYGAEQFIAALWLASATDDHPGVRLGAECALEAVDV